MELLHIMNMLGCLLLSGAAGHGTIIQPPRPTESRMPTLARADLDDEAYVDEDRSIDDEMPPPPRARENRREARRVDAPPPPDDGAGIGREHGRQLRAIAREVMHRFLREHRQEIRHMLREEIQRTVHDRKGPPHVGRGEHEGFGFYRGERKGPGNYRQECPGPMERPRGGVRGGRDVPPPPPGIGDEGARPERRAPQGGRRDGHAGNRAAKNPGMETFFNRFDLDRDGVVTAEEFDGNPTRFERLDLNSDGKIDRQELTNANERRMEDRRGPAKSRQP